MEHGKIIKSLEGLDFNDLGNYTWYSEEENVSIFVGCDRFVITDLANALKRGKEANEFRIMYDNRKEFNCYIYNLIYNNYKSIKEFVESVLEGTFNVEGVILKKSTYKAIRQFSPFVKQKKINIPEKWTIQHIAKAILSGQIERGICTKSLTDDYLYDYETNFGMGNIDVLDICKDVIESPSGWWCYCEKDEDGFVELSVNCYHFNCNKLFFNINGKKELIFETLENKDNIINFSELKLKSVV